MAKKKAQVKKTPSVKKAKKVSVRKVAPKKAKVVLANTAQPKKRATRTLAADTVRDFFHRVRVEAFPRIEAATVPIYGYQDNQVKQNRTGVLFRIADTHFILTAAHDLFGIIENHIPLYADFSRTHQAPIPIVESKFNGTEEENGRDVAAIELPTSVVADLPENRRFLTMADLDMEAQPKKGIYAAFGFPTAWYRRVEDVQRTDPLAFLESPYYNGRGFSGA